MSDAIRLYQDALREHEKARAEALSLIKMIENVSSALRGSAIRPFLFRNYSLPTATRDSHHSPQMAKFDMNQWPDAQRLRETLTKWHGSFTKLHEAWNAIVPNDRIGLQGPPPHLDSI